MKSRPKRMTDEEFVDADAASAYRECRRARASESDGIKAAEKALEAFDLSGELASEAESAQAAYEWGDTLARSAAEKRIREIRAQIGEAVAALRSFLAAAKGGAA